MLNLNNFNTVLHLLPYATSLFGAVYIYLRLNFYSVKNFLTKFESGGLRANSQDLTPLISFLTLSLLLATVLIGGNTVAAPRFNCCPITMLLLLSYNYVLSSHNNRNSHWLFGSFFSIIFALLLLNSADIFNFFFLLEVNTYLFLYLSICQTQNTTSSQNKSVINAVLVAFIINFFSSIAIFSSIFYLLYLNGSSIFYTSNSVSNVFFIFFALKLLSGPWVYFGVEVYKGFKYLTLLVYTLIFVLVLVPKMFSFIANFNISVEPYLYVPLLLYTLTILVGTRNVNSLKVFLAYSTSFNFMYVFIFYVIINYNPA